jgi:hypothetical protein
MVRTIELKSGILLVHEAETDFLCADPLPAWSPVLILDSFEVSGLQAGRVSV